MRAVREEDGKGSMMKGKNQTEAATTIWTGSPQSA